MIIVIIVCNLCYDLFESVVWIQHHYIKQQFRLLIPKDYKESVVSGIEIGLEI